MLPRLLSPEVSAGLPAGLVTTILLDVLDPEGAGALDPVCLAGAARDMYGRIRGMPKYLGGGIVALTRLYGVGYARLPRDRRLARLEAWRASPVSFCRDFVEFWEKMGTFVYYSNLEHRLASTAPAAPP